MTIRTLTAAAGLLAAMTVSNPALGDGFVVDVDSKAHTHNENKSGFSWVRTVHDDDGTTYEIRVDDEEMRFFINGEEVGRDDFEKDGRLIHFTDDDGNEASFNVDVNFPDEAEDVAFFNVNRPKVMLGINLDSAPESLLKHLGVDGGAIIVERVMDGLSADKAGIKTDDIIVSIDGIDGLSSIKLTEVLSKYEPGDNAEFVVIRKGDRKKLNLEFMKYDPARMGVTVRTIPAAPAAQAPPAIQGWTSSGGSGGVVIGKHGRELRAVTQDRIASALKAAGVGQDQILIVTREVNDALKDMEEGLRNVVVSGVLPQVEFRADQAERMADEMRAKAEQALRQAERQMLEFRDGRLMLREQARELNRHLGHTQQQLEQKHEGITEELEHRLAIFEERMAMVDERMVRMVETFERFAEKVIERLEEDDD